MLGIAPRKQRDTEVAQRGRAQHAVRVPRVDAPRLTGQPADHRPGRRLKAQQVQEARLQCLARNAGTTFSHAKGLWAESAPFASQPGTHGGPYAAIKDDAARSVTAITCLWDVVGHAERQRQHPRLRNTDLRVAAGCVVTSAGARPELGAAVRLPVPYLDAAETRTVEEREARLRALRRRTSGDTSARQLRAFGVAPSTSRSPTRPSYP
ncbi:hypothetical protein [Streptomyces sp. NPDC096012]|uniref:hypothetical protein n=1 Tax=Streptomyces sp. NPDC096012 TaxID=3155684 RepID=UPI00336A1E37